MKGVVLAGGKGTRLLPLTELTNKHLLPVFDRPMIEYPLRTLLKSGISDILIVSGRERAGHFVEYLGSGSRYDAKFTYKVQDEAGGIAQALLLAQDFTATHDIAVILGDNVFEDDLSEPIRKFYGGAKVFLKEVPDAERFGVAVLEDGCLAAGTKLVARIIEKPQSPPTQLAVTGLYIYDSTVFHLIRMLKPSARGELEITDVNNIYARRGELRAEFLRGFWSDAGTFESLARATKWAMEKKAPE